MLFSKIIFLSLGEKSPSGPISRVFKLSSFISSFFNLNLQFISAKKYYDVEEGEYLAILNTGAYGSSMSSNYNVRPLLEEVMIDGNDYYKIRNRQKFEDLINNEIDID